MADRQVLRLFRFRPSGVGFDAIMRDEIIPDLLALPGLLDVHVGRQGPNEVGERIVASIWTSRDAMATGVGEDFDPPMFHPEHLDRTTDRRLEWLSLDAHLRFTTPAAAAVGVIIRLGRGQVRPDQLHDYVAEVRRGTRLDAEAGHGPLVLYLATTPPDRFLTLSVWASWVALEQATGGDLRRPVATRHEERIVAFEASHYECLPNLGPPAPAVSS